MRKHRVSMLATYYADSKTLSWHVEHESDGGVWELLSEGTSTSLRELSDLFGGLLDAFQRATADG